MEYTTWALAMVGRAISGAEYAGALRYLQRASRGIGAFFERYDVLLTPTVASPPFPHGALQPSPAERHLLTTMGRVRGGRLLRALGMVDKLADTVYEFMPFTAPFNVSGQPAMSVPLWWNGEGLPIGVQSSWRVTRMRQRSSGSRGSSSARGRGSSAHRRSLGDGWSC